MTLAPVAKNIKKQTHAISPRGIRRSLARTGRDARTKIQSQMAFSAMPKYSRGLTIFPSRQWPSTFGLRRFEMVGMPHWKRLINMNAKLYPEKTKTEATMT
jgi:hypothetical protein